MTTPSTPSPLALAARDLATRSAGARGRRALARLAAAGAPVEGCRDPFDLARSCHGPGGRDLLEALVAALFPLVPGDEVAMLCLLVAMRPVLGTLATRAERSGPRGGERTEMESATVTALLEAVADLSRPAVPASLTVLVHAVWSRLRSELRRQRTSDGDRVVASVEDDADAGADPAEVVTTLLADARRRGVVTPRQAYLMSATRLADRPVEEIGLRLGISRATVWKDRRRGELALAAFVLRGAEVER
ncbi:MAG: hypothetical protein ACRDYB_06240 [Acidimicrobiales bacterium]